MADGFSVIQIEFPSHIRRAKDALWYACEQLSARGITNFIHNRDIVVVTVNDVDVYPVIDLVNRLVIFDRIVDV